MRSGTFARSVRATRLCLLLLVGACQGSIPDQALFGSNSHLSHAIDRAVKAELGESISDNLCIRPNPGFTVRECTLVRWDRNIPMCSRRRFDDGHCRAIELRASLLTDSRVASIITEASKEFCTYVSPPTERGSDAVRVIGCTGPPAPDWRLFNRTAPLTICVTGLEEGAAETPIAEFVVRDGERVANDEWCNALFDSKS